MGFTTATKHPACSYSYIAANLQPQVMQACMLLPMLLLMPQMMRLEKVHISTLAHAYRGYLLEPSIGSKYGVYCKLHTIGGKHKKQWKGHFTPNVSWPE